MTRLLPSKMNVVCRFGLDLERHLRLLLLTLLSVAMLVVAMLGVAEEQPDPVEAGWRGMSVCDVLREDAEMRVFRCTFPPGVGHERHCHERHFGYALSGGTMRITSDAGTREVTLKTGSYFFSEGIAWHEALNVGDTPVSYLMIEPK